MQDVRKNIAENIALLRTEAGMTQASLAEILNYTDKAVSKWERGEAVPDIVTIKQIADYFGVSVDYLLRRDHKEDLKEREQLVAARKKNRRLITLICGLSVFVLATVAFAILILASVTAPPPWICFVYAVPISSIVVLVLNSVWGARWLNFIIVSVLVWSVLSSVYFTLLTVISFNMWEIFIVGASAQLVILFIPGIKPVKNNNSKEQKNNGT
ncbi:MAG: helix-turn-helix transcriptional regulator [Clostridia bacterium]|nr:helix-turn-helix transcriptional regulator [Clostridia bacterium]